MIDASPRSCKPTRRPAGCQPDTRLPRRGRGAPEPNLASNAECFASRAKPTDSGSLWASLSPFFTMSKSSSQDTAAPVGGDKSGQSGRKSPRAGPDTVAAYRCAEEGQYLSDADHTRRCHPGPVPTGSELAGLALTCPRTIPSVPRTERAAPAASVDPGPSPASRSTPQSRRLAPHVMDLLLASPPVGSLSSWLWSAGKDRWQKF